MNFLYLLGDSRLLIILSPVYTAILWSAFVYVYSEMEY